VKLTKTPELWVAAFDGGKALIFRNSGTAVEVSLDLVAQFDNENGPDREQTSDAAGRLPDGAGRGGGAGLPAGVAHGASAVAQTDRHDLEEERFVAGLIDHLNRQAAADAFQAIIILAGEVALGQARRHFSAALDDKIAHQEAKDVVNEPTPAIAARVQTLLNA
jgi:protein required for attachment to host cells